MALNVDEAVKAAKVKLEDEKQAALVGYMAAVISKRDQCQADIDRVDAMSPDELDRFCADRIGRDAYGIKV